MSQALSRRRFLRGALTGQSQPAPPPWALDGPAFQDTCERGGACVRVCREGILVTGDGGFPRVSFAEGSCTFCRECAQACLSGALSLFRADGKTLRAPWAIRAHVSEECLSLMGTTCRVCGGHCDAEAISFRLAVGGVAIPEIDTALCNGCGACVAPCPTKAIDVR